MQYAPTASRKARIEALQQQILEIRNACQHVYRPTEGSFHLGQSRVASVLIGSIAGNPITIHLECPECGDRKSCTASTMCPTCGGAMKKGDMHYREEFFPDGEHLYYGARIFCCSSCNGKVAMDEWDG